jgi:dihydrofolate synthase / folylpolyglutamate synthase
VRIPIHSYEAFTRHLGDREYFGQRLGLERIQGLLDRLGNPQEKFRSIHIAGTNGKGSTAAMLAAILKEAGHKTGLYTSPHLEDFCERVRVEQNQISPDEVLRHARHIREIEDDPLSFFELATAIGFLHFAESGVDVAVVETGLGGRLDATNVLTPVLSVITSIGKDHTAQLGETVEEIAFEKAGIIKPGVPVVVGQVPPEALEVIREQASVKKARFIPIVMDLIPPNIRIGLEGAHQRRNANLAVASVDVLNALGELRLSRDAVWSGLEGVRWPGRLETLSDEPWILLDGAHNPDAMRSVREFLEESLQGRRLHVLFGAMADKDVSGMLRELEPLAPQLVVTAPALKRAMASAEILETAARLGMEASSQPDTASALKAIGAAIDPDDVLLVTGSFYLIGEAKKWFSENG